MQINDQDMAISGRFNIKDENHLRFIISSDVESILLQSWGQSDNKYELICHVKDQLTKIELEQIVCEIRQLMFTKMDTKVYKSYLAMLPHVDCRLRRNDESKRSQHVIWKGRTKKLLGSITKFEVIPMNHNHLPCVIGFGTDFDLFPLIKPQYQTVFKSSKGQPCPFMLKHKRPCNFLNTKNVQIKGNKNLQELTLKHFSNYDHFECFGNKKPMCPHKNNDKCVHFQNVLHDKNNIQDNYDGYFEDYRHLYLYFHKPSDHKMDMQKDNVDVAINHDQTEFAFGSLLKHTNFDWYSWGNFNTGCFGTLGNECINYNYNFLLLINEVISNGFENDLLPVNVDSNTGTTNLVSEINWIINHNRGDPLAQNLGFDTIKSIRKKLETNYKIFDILNEKMNHERHKKMGTPLHEYLMLALILYCNGTCNHNLCQSQRDGTWSTKWRCFDAGLLEAITELSQYEIHDENIYSGLAGIIFNTNQLYGNAEIGLYFKTCVSFSRDLRVAREFRTNEGLILGINLYRAWLYSLGGSWKHPCACDVSWISKYPTEKEVLVARKTQFPICPSKCLQIGKKQWVVCNKGDDDKVSFKSMFLANNNVLN